MKRLMALLLAALCLTGCQNRGTALPDSGPAQEPLAVLTAIWEAYSQEDWFSVWGGEMAEPVSGAPGALDAQDTQTLMQQYLVPQNKLSQVRQGASLVHAMNGNLFTAAALRLSGSADSFASAWARVIRENTWICGQPERLLMVYAGGCLIAAYGAGELMESFAQALKSAFPQAEVLCDETIG